VNIASQSIPLPSGPTRSSCTTSLGQDRAEVRAKRQGEMVEGRHRVATTPTCQTKTTGVEEFKRNEEFLLISCPPVPVALEGGRRDHLSRVDQWSPGGRYNPALWSMVMSLRPCSRRIRPVRPSGCR
jgi:hypothetical protein